jgi:DNA-binding transcriptional ArsR family regulator
LPRQKEYATIWLHKVDDIFKALADPSRRALLDQLHQANGQSLNELCRHLDLTRQGITKHLAILIQAELVVPLWRGRQKLHYLNPAPLKQISERWIDKHKSACLRALNDLTRSLEQLESERD